jgi:hypothetical protein
MNMRKIFSILSHKEMQIETTLRFYHNPIRMAIIKKINNSWRSGSSGRVPAWQVRGPEF